MRLLNLSIENWRAIDSRQIQLSGGVTLIEGRNEIGKSTIVEAIRMLFSEMDSSKKKDVKAIQPVGQDIGSSIQAEVTAGDYHFIYAKTFNKSPQTTLDIKTPKKQQLSGREAHEEVERILGETVDLALWEALLVEQGEKIALANLQDSTGLAKALDEAAGSGSAGGEDTGLYTAVQTEYEKYFTLKTGKSKFSDLEDACQEARTALEESRQSLIDVEADSQAHHQSAAEVRRLTSLLPGLKTKLEEHEKNWSSISTLKEQLGVKEKELNSARALEKAATEAFEDRLNLVKDIKTEKKNLKLANKKLAPLQDMADKLKEQAKSAQLLIDHLKQELKTAKTALDLARDDEIQVRNLAVLAAEEDRLKQLDELSTTMKTELKLAASITIDNNRLQDIRQAERQMDITSGQRDSAATIVSVAAEKPLDLNIDGEAIHLDKTGIEERSVATELMIQLPGIVSIHLTPPLSVAALQEEAEEAKTAFEDLKSSLGVKDLEEAESLNERRIAAQTEVERLKQLELTILKGANRQEIEQTAISLQANYDGYLKQRKSEQALPDDMAQASEHSQQAKDDQDVKEQTLEAMQLKSENLLSEHELVDKDIRVAQQELSGIQAALGVKQDRLEQARSGSSDDALELRIKSTGIDIRQLELETDRLQAALKESSPDSTEALLNNAKDVYERAGSDLIQEKQGLAVLSDRLHQAQADGRFETKESAKRELKERETVLAATRRRAEAVTLLWKTLNQHRDTARQSYVRPLKEALERLGTIVFGSDFEVELDDDWSLKSRSLHGKTLPFDALSIGAKEQLGILTRLAAGQIISKQGGVPLIIDDALGFSDPARLETMGTAISAAGKTCQIIILTCTPGRFTHVGNAEVVKF